MRIDGSLTPVGALGRDPGPAPARERATPAALSAEETAYFAELERLGPLVYGRRPGGQHAPPPVLGQRVDVRA